jgi:hypothetical protein
LFLPTHSNGISVYFAARFSQSVQHRTCPSLGFHSIGTAVTGIGATQRGLEPYLHSGQVPMAIHPTGVGRLQPDAKATSEDAPVPTVTTSRSTSGNLSAATHRALAGRKSLRTCTQFRTLLTKWATVERRSFRLLRSTAKQFLLVPSIEPKACRPPCLTTLISGQPKHPSWAEASSRTILTTLLPNSTTITFPPPDGHTRSHCSLLGFSFASAPI